MAAEAGVAAASAAAVGFGLFDYNRANYLYDAEFRFERFSTGREYAVEQANQFRNDLRTLSALTMVKNNQYAGLAALDMALCIALYCAGRLGLHGPSPPGWIMALWITSNAASFAFMALAILLALHASYRAQAASVNLLTRKIRVPVPSMRHLDKARRFSSEFEQQQWSDILRVPYLTNPGVPKTDETSAKVAGSASRARSASPGRRSRSSKASSWIREEFETDRAGTVTGTMQPGGLLPADSAPEHFRLYAAVQKEWFQYDIYARVCMLLGFSAFVQSLAFYGNGHIIVELRAFYVAHATAFVIEVLHVLLLRFDIIQGRVKSTDRTPAWFLWLGPASVAFATVGLSLDFRTQFNIVAIIFTWICIFGAYICQFCYQLRILEVILPDDVRNPLKLEENIGDAWWPASWRCPSAFAHVLYFVAPPSRLQPGQFDLVREMKNGPQDDAFESAGVAGLESKPVDTSDASANPGMTAEEIAAQVQYLDRLFDYFMSDQVHSQMSESNRQRVKDLFAEFSSARRKGAGPEAVRTFTDCLIALEGVQATEGLMKEGDFGTDTGYTSTGSMGSSGSSGEEEEESVKGYTWDGRRLWKTDAAVRLFQKKGEIEPWRLINVLQLAICGAWAFLILAMVVDIFLGDQGLVTAPHWSRPPMSRLSLEPHELGTPLGFPWYAGAKPWLPEQMAWHEEKREAMSGFISAPHSGQEEGGGGHSNIHKGEARRLSADVHASPARSALRDILELLPGSEPVKEVPVQTVWPGFFEPRMLACGPHGIAALSPRGVGALVPPAVARHRAFEAARRFRLSGLTHLPPLLSAAFHPESQELMVVTRGGHVATCPDAGASPCAVGHAGLPVSAALRAAAVAWLRDEASKEHHLHAAFIDEALPGLVAVFKLLGKGQAATWHPLGEFSAPFSDEVKEPLSAKVSLSFAPGEIVLTTASGIVHRRRLQDGLLAESSHRFGGVSTVAQWQDACPMTGGGLAHLRLRRKEGSQAWTPELLTQKLEHTEGRPSLFQ
mmetsp:Transcript_148899/g.211476  ORF Transcript_148899/g.211476 Transcript_148899/m.211476 type:complete len:1011 (-) Transcript_148899:49-3081(-)